MKIKLSTILLLAAVTVGCGTPKASQSNQSNSGLSQRIAGQWTGTVTGTFGTWTFALNTDGTTASISVDAGSNAPCFPNAALPLQYPGGVMFDASGSGSNSTDIDLSGQLNTDGTISGNITFSANGCSESNQGTFVARRN